MTEVTTEELRVALEALRVEFDEFKAYAKPVIDGHQPDTRERSKNPPSHLLPKFE